MSYSTTATPSLGADPCPTCPTSEFDVLSVLYHSVISVALLIVFCAVRPGDAPMEPCMMSRTAGIMLSSLSVPLIVLKVYFETMQLSRLSEQKRVGRLLFLLRIVCLALDVWLISIASGMFEYCVVNEGKREFWAENRTVAIEAADLAVPSADISREELARLMDGESKSLDVDGPILTKCPQRCLGTANLGEPGVLWVRIIDPSNGKTIRESEKVSAEWSNNPDEKFVYDVFCPISRGRYSKYYRVRCEVWATTELDGRDKLIVAKDVITNGALKGL